MTLRYNVRIRPRHLHCQVTGAVTLIDLRKQADMKTVPLHGSQPTNQHVGTRIRAARMAAKLTTRQLAEKTGLRQTSICNVESGQFRPGLEAAERIAAAVGVELSMLIDGLPDRPLRRRGPHGASWSAEYFWQRVDKRGPDECWPWTKGLNDNGYGSLAFRAKSMLAHQVAYVLSVEPVPDGLELDHTCHDPDVCAPGGDCPHRRCCNPAHLKPVTPSVNKRRRRPRKANPGLTVNQRFGLHVRVARRRAGLSQSELGEMVGLAKTSVSLIESGERDTNATRRAAFIAALNLDPENP